MSSDDALLEQLLAEDGYRLDAAADSIAHEPSGEGMPRVGPLSHAQQRLYFLDGMLADKSSYHIVYCVHFGASLDVQRLRQAFTALAQRHPILRTGFRLMDAGQGGELDNQLVQEVLPDVVADWSEAALPVAGIEALRHVLSPSKRAMQPSVVLDALQAFSARAFTLSRAPLSRQCLYQLEDGSYLLQWVLHHMVSDGWSRELLIADLAALYLQHAGADVIALQDRPPIDYIDYARWQRSEARAAQHAAQLEYWREALSPLPEPLALPTDRARPVRPSGRGDTVPVALADDTVRGVHAMAKRWQVTPFVLLLCSFQYLLYRLSGQARFLTGIPAANRDQPEIQGVAGMFLNTLVMDSDFTEAVKLEQFARGMQAQLARAQEHQSVPFERVVETLLTRRDISLPPLIQHLFSLQPVAATRTRLGDLSVEQFALPTRTSKLDLSLYLVEEAASGTQAAAIHGVFEFATDLFDAETVVQMADTWRQLVSAMIQQSDTALQQLDILSVEDKLKQRNWMGDSLHYQSRGVLDLYRAQLALTPDALAVSDGEHSLSYRALDRRSNDIAAGIDQRLRELGRPVAEDTLIAVMLPRNCDLLATLLGIFKLGCAYLPLDPDYPDQRIDYIWRDSAAVLLVTTDALHGQSSLCADPVLHLDTVCVDAPPMPALADRAGRLAYVTYTSGSTGKPKGVMVEQGNVAALLEWGRTEFTAEQCRGVLFSTSVCFDLSVFEMFMPLSCGGAVLVAENALALPELNQSLEAREALPPVSLVNTVPSAIRALCRERLLPDSVQTIILCGELLPQDLVDELYAQTSVHDVYDLYGPSEDTVYSTCVRRSPHGRQTIGRPIANTQAYVLDAWMNQQPVGAVGELYLGGAGVARGYLHRPELTTERFIANPFEHPYGHGGRLYRTGDLVKQCADGQLVYLRRLDDQVKLRGYRVELGEVNAALGALPDVEEAVSVVAHEEGNVSELIAYVVARPGTTASDEWIAGLRQALSRQLPGYMVPSSWVMLPVLPRTPNGKLDRGALPPPQLMAARPSAPMQAPEGETERALAEIWVELLPVDVVGRSDNFFLLGGHSLLVLRLRNLVQERLAVSLDLAELFTYADLAAMARGVEAGLRACEPETLAELDALLDELEDN